MIQRVKSVINVIFGQGNNSTSSSDENYSISSESSPLEDNNIERNYPLDDGSNEFDIDDIVDTDNIMQSNVK